MKKHKGLKIALIVLGVIVLLIGGIALRIAFHPQTAIGLMQKIVYSDGKEINSFDPFNEPGSHVKGNGILYVNDIKYGDTYPNSYLDISYPNEDTSVDRTTIVYFHGGGFFGGDKASGDPMAESDDSNYLFEQLVLEGYNLVNVDYALVPDYHFPVPMLQMNEAINYLIDHQEELGLNMHDVIIFGGSAGAVMTAQYGAILSNPEYRALYSLAEAPKLQLEDVRALIVDDAPIDIPSFDNLSIKIIISNYLDDNIFFGNKDTADWYNPIGYLTEDYPRTFMTAGTDDGFPKDMQKMSDELTKLGVENEYFYTDKNKYGLTAHGYLSNLKNDTTGAAWDCYNALIEFMKR